MRKQKLSEVKKLDQDHVACNSQAGTQARLCVTPKSCPKKDEKNKHLKISSDTLKAANVEEHSCLLVYSVCFLPVLVTIIIKLNIFKFFLNITL